MIVRCDRCNRQLIVPGAIVLSPPDQEGNVRKRHLCLSCWYDVRGLIFAAAGQV